MISTFIVLFEISFNLGAKVQNFFYIITYTFGLHWIVGGITRKKDMLLDYMDNSSKNNLTAKQSFGPAFNNALYGDIR